MDNDTFLNELASTLKGRWKKNRATYAGVLFAVCFLEGIKVPGPKETPSDERLENLLISVLGNETEYRTETVLVQKYAPGEYDQGNPRYLIQLLADV